MSTKVTFQAEASDEQDQKFMRYLENAANGSITVQDLHAFSIEPRSKVE